MEHRPKKRFGQNFLRDLSVVEAILTAAGLQPSDRVLEIGPGLGVLTERMLPQVERLLVMELDRDLVQRLEERGGERLEIHSGDALDMDWAEILGAPPYKLVANLPYNISSQIIFKVLEHRERFSRLVLMFQKEVGERLRASPGTKEYGILSVFCRLWFDIRRVTSVPPGAFHPPPKVHSVVLAFEPLAGPRVPVADEPFFRRVVKGAFGQRRKTLRNALLAAGFVAAQVDRACAGTDIDPGRRGETLDLDEFARLARALQSIESGAR